MDEFVFADDCFEIETREFATKEQAIAHAKFLGCNVYDYARQPIFINPSIYGIACCCEPSC